jgi:hypothetical protein
VLTSWLSYSQVMVLDCNGMTMSELWSASCSTRKVGWARVAAAGSVSMLIIALLHFIVAVSATSAGDAHHSVALALNSLNVQNAVMILSWVAIATSFGATCTHVMRGVEKGEEVRNMRLGLKQGLQQGAASLSA